MIRVMMMMMMMMLKTQFFLISVNIVYRTVVYICDV